MAVATALIYPIPFLYTSDFTSGASSLPRHVWTNAQPIKDRLTLEPDVIMRSIWVHGSYMKALDREVLVGALELQDELLGPTKDFDPRRPSNQIVIEDPLEDLTSIQRNTFHVVNGLTNQSWFFHSPLLYWSGDRGAIENDPDIIATVNEHREQHTSVNVTLRHSVVFSGKRFEDRALVAADALVITLIHLRDSPVGEQWERKTTEFAAHIPDKWDIYPTNAQNLSSQLYEFQFLPISTQDSVMLFVVYFITFIYLVQNLSKLPAIKSRPGLIVTVIAQIFVSIMSSFTVCAILKIDLSRIPRAAYPVVIISMSLENMLRLIKSVVATNLEDCTSDRIGTAFGKTTHIAFASVVEHIILLWGISKLVTEGLSDFCIFLAIAIVFDFFCLSTFFLCVLSVEVRRSELSDFIEKASLVRRNRRSSSDPMYPSSLSHESMKRPSWISAVLQGRIDISTRIAGTIILLSFVVIGQWHFFGNESMFRTLGRIVLPGMDMGSPANNLTAWTSSSAEFGALHQARSPTSWLRLQDHDTAREVINVVKPWAHSYIARVYEPLIFVLKGSDRMPSVSERPLLPAVYDFVRHQSKPFVVTVLIFTAAMRILVNYLLWDEMAETDREMENVPLLSVKTLDRGHSLDVALLAATPDGLVVSVGLDRLIRVWNVPFGGMSYLLTKQDGPSEVPFPVLALTIDNDSTWLAILSTYTVMLWNLESDQWGPSMAIDLYGQKPEAFFFTSFRKGPYMHSLIIVRRNGTLAELWLDTGESVDHPICRSPLVCAVPLSYPHSSSGGLAILTASRNGCIHRVMPVGDRWLTEEVKEQAVNKEHAHFLVTMPLFSAYLVVRSRSVDLVDLATSRTLHTFVTPTPIKTRSLRYLCSTRRQSQKSSPELSSFSLIYTSTETGNCVIQSYLPGEEDGSIKFFADEKQPGTPATSDRCCSWYEARQVVKEVPNPGIWETLPNGCIIGVRQTMPVQQNKNEDSTMDFDAPSVEGISSLRRRGLRILSSAKAPANSGDPSTAFSTSRKVSASQKATPSDMRGKWEAWSISSVADYASSGNSTAGGSERQSNDGSGKDRNYVTRPIEADQDGLLVAEPGPIACLGAGTVALGFGATVKVITMGHERFGSLAEMLEEAAGQMMGTSAVGNRRRKGRPIQKVAAM